jgi:putative effector of murein hydrolase
MMALVAYLTRGLQLLFGSSKRALAQRAEELGDQNGNSSNRSSTEGIPLAENASVAGTATPGVASAAPSRPQTPPQLRLQDHHHNHGHVAESLLDLASQGQQQQPAQAPIPTLRADRWAAILVAHADVATFAALFLFVGLPVYYAAGYAMPAHLALTVLAYMAAMAVPASWRQFLHPVLVSSLFTVLGVWALSALRPLPDDSLTSALLAYRTGSKYLRLWEAASSSSSSDAIPPPGAGDVFGSLLDAAIVALALPMFQYRRELRAHALALTIPSLLTSLGSVVAYPPLCHAVGIAPERALAFSARSLTLALAAPAVANLGGDSNTVAALAILSGILGVLCGNRLLALLRVPDDDYVTRGVTLGINSSAIATALLLRTDPRAAALSSLSMSLFGAVTVLFTSIPPAAHLVRSFVGL